MAMQFKKLLPLFNRVLVAIAEAEKKTVSGIILTENVDPIKYGKVVEVNLFIIILRLDQVALIIMAN